jgi:CubicO group peptidase (beta-lactamase class C family)
VSGVAPVAERAGPSTHAPRAARLLAPLVTAAPGATAVVLGVARDGRREFAVHGDHVGEATAFETGSLTKTFTALLLAELAARGELAVAEPVARHLPAGCRPPRGGEGITALHLATHTAGLPRLPPGTLRRALPHWRSNPYAALSVADVLSGYGRTRLRAAPGTRVGYSNFGVGLLGPVLATAAGRGPGEYPALLAERVLGPLGLRESGCDPGAPQATGHLRGRPLPPWRIPGLEAAGGLRCSARDLLTVLEALADPAAAPPGTPAPLRAALAGVRRPRLELPGGRRLALVWNVRPRPGGADLWHHSGGTRGGTAFAGFCPATRTALVALADAGPTVGAALRGGFVQRAYEALHACARPVSPEGTVAPGSGSR